MYERPLRAEQPAARQIVNGSCVIVLARPQGPQRCLPARSGAPSQTCDLKFSLHSASADALPASSALNSWSLWSDGPAARPVAQIARARPNGLNGLWPVSGRGGMERIRGAQSTALVQCAWMRRRLLLGASGEREPLSAAGSRLSAAGSRPAMFASSCHVPATESPPCTLQQQCNQTCPAAVVTAAAVHLPVCC